jgi:hypothetical protein
MVGKGVVVVAEEGQEEKQAEWQEEEQAQQAGVSTGIQYQQC